MIAGIIMLAAGACQFAYRVVDTRGFDTSSDRATVVELIERPSGIGDEGFARTLIEASGLRPWNGKIIEFPASPGHMGVKAVHSGTGPEVTIYFPSSDSRKVGRVCRIGRKDGGMTDAWKKAQDWCASRFGLPPLKRVPPIETVNAPVK